MKSSDLNGWPPSMVAAHIAITTADVPARKPKRKNAGAWVAISVAIALAAASAVMK